MRPQELEVLVRQRVLALRAGRKAEDDRVEFKSNWPEPQKAARQLAGSCNRQAGEALVYVIGVYDKDGAATSVSEIEAGDWLAQVAKWFDQSIVPHLVRHQVVALSDKETVQALLFSTSEYPYVVKLADGNRDVPFRAGSNTRSAHRHELVDLLHRELELPPMAVVHASMFSDYSFTPKKPKDAQGNEPLEADETFSVHVEVAVLVEYIGDGAVTIRERQLRMRLRADDYLQHLEPQLDTGRHGVQFVRMGESPPAQSAPPRFGVYVRDGQVVATTPGTFGMSAGNRLTRRYPAPEVGEIAETFRSVDRVSLDLVIEVTGARRQARLTVELQRTEAPAESVAEPWTHEKATRQRLGEWSIVERFEDPWADDE